MSDTSFEVSSADLMSYIHALKTSSWIQNSELFLCQLWKMKKLEKQFSNLIKSENSELFELIVLHFRKVLKKLMIHKFNKFKWFKYSILKMFSNTYEDIDCVIEKEYKLTLKNMKNETHKQIQEKFNAQTKK